MFATRLLFSCHSPPAWQVYFKACELQNPRTLGFWRMPSMITVRFAPWQESNNVFNDCEEIINSVEHSNAKTGATTSALKKILRSLHPSRLWGNWPKGFKLKPFRKKLIRPTTFSGRFRWLKQSGRLLNFGTRKHNLLLCPALFPRILLQLMGITNLPSC